MALTPGKADDAFRTIGEVADELDVPKHVLRFWELKFPQLRPMKRGGGRRYYRPEDTRLLRGIRELLYRDRYTIRGVQKILREQGLEAVKVVGETMAPEAEAATPEHPTRNRDVPKSDVRRAEAVESGGAGLILRQAIAELELCRAIMKGDAVPGRIGIGAAANAEGSAAA